MCHKFSYEFFLVQDTWICLQYFVAKSSSPSSAMFLIRETWIHASFLYVKLGPSDISFSSWCQAAVHVFCLWIRISLAVMYLMWTFVTGMSDNTVCRQFIASMAAECPQWQIIHWRSEMSVSWDKVRLSFYTLLCWSYSDIAHVNENQCLSSNEVDILCYSV